jgi:hypothetical protein
MWNTDLIQPMRIQLEDNSYIYIYIYIYELYSVQSFNQDAHLNIYVYIYIPRIYVLKPECPLNTKNMCE